MRTKKDEGVLHVYKVTFVKNQVDSCKLAEDISFGDNVTYQEYKGQLIHAFIKAESEAVAKEKAGEIAARFTK